MIFSTSLVERRPPFDFVDLYIPSNPFNSAAGLSAGQPGSGIRELREYMDGLEEEGRDDSGRVRLLDSGRGRKNSPVGQLCATSCFSAYDSITLRAIL
jgi:hypothetical protein